MQGSLNSSTYNTGSSRIQSALGKSVTTNREGLTHQPTTTAESEAKSITPTLSIKNTFDQYSAKSGKKKKEEEHQLFTNDKSSYKNSCSEDI